MIVRMRFQMSGGRHDGRAWPPPATPFEVPDWEGLDLIRGGMADPHGREAEKLAREVAEHPTPGHPSKLDEPEPEPEPEPAQAETEPGPEPPVAGTVADDGAGDSGVAEGESAAEPAPDPPLPGPAADTPSPASPKQAWIDYAVSVHGADVHAAGNMTKADLMSRYGGRL